MARPADKALIDHFIDGTGPPRIFAYFQEMQQGGDNFLFMTDGDSVRILRKAIYFSRTIDRKINTN